MLDARAGGNVARYNNITAAWGGFWERGDCWLSVHYHGGVGADGTPPPPLRQFDLDPRRSDVDAESPPAATGIGGVALAR